ncbi:MAG: hypothetical protein KZQ56_01310 [gamma proteobacterium symbiont of Lucinoma myriamae]|nr:hypothetical protein [gamma proteobacterium symbiont of Lucinoma myriamae]
MSHEKIQTNKKVEFLNTLRIQVATDLKIFISLQDKAPDAVLINELNKIDFPFCLTITPDSEFDSILLLQNALAEIKIPTIHIRLIFWMKNIKVSIQIRAFLRY